MYVSCWFDERENAWLDASCTRHNCMHIQVYFYSGMYAMDNGTKGTFKMPIEHDKTINETELVSQ